MNIDLVLSLALALLTHAGEISALITKAKSENRDITDAELQAVFDADALARARLTVAIAAAKAAGH
ncbi:MAG: hypothetical protein V4457_06135 [Pseudomonadota bacterium]